MVIRHCIWLAAAVLAGATNEAAAQADMPTANDILRRLNAAPAAVIRPEDRVTERELLLRPDLRGVAPSIDIQAINFAFGSAEIAPAQEAKVETIAKALRELIEKRPGLKVLIEGHTDAVGSTAFNKGLSERRAAALKSALVTRFGLPGAALSTVGYGEEFLIVKTAAEDWRNRRVALRRVDELVR